MIMNELKHGIKLACGIIALLSEIIKTPGCPKMIATSRVNSLKPRFARGFYFSTW